MNKKVSRKEKLLTLQAIREGKLTPSSLRPPQVYIFTEINSRPGFYLHKGNEFSESEYREFCTKIQRNNNGSITWKESRSYLNEDKIVTLRFGEK